MSGVAKVEHGQVCAYNSFKDTIRQISREEDYIAEKAFTY